MDQPQDSDNTPYTLQDSVVVIGGSDAQYQQLFEELSHAFQNPLAYLRTTLSLCRDRVLDRDTASQLEQSITSLSDMARSMLAYSRSSYPTTEKTYIALGELVVSVCTVLEPLARESGITISRFITPDLYVIGDARQLSEVIDNLISNAIRYTAACAVRTVSVSFFREETMVVLNVSDTGIGIPEEEIGLVKERLYRATNARSHPGTGFGLAISERIVREHGGYLTIESRVGQGTIVRVSIPQAQ